MADIRNFDFSYNRLTPSIVNISGTVTKEGSPAARTIELYEGTQFISNTISDAGTGNFSFEAPGGPSTIFRVIMIGDVALEEASLIFDRIQE